MNTLMVFLQDDGLLSWKPDAHGARWRSNRRDIYAVTDEALRENAITPPFIIDYVTEKN